jgi:hypothetical protein
MPCFLLLSLTGGVRRYFAREAARDRTETRVVPADAPRLIEGQRVVFELNVGEDGPCYATKVQVIADAPEKKADRSA